MIKPNELNVSKKKISALMLKSIFLALITLSACTQNPVKVKKEVANHLYDNLEFSMPEVKAPEFPDYKVSITDFGAVPGGQFLNTEAFSKAIDAVAKKGGGTVVIPRGLWLTGPIILKNNVNLHANKGALIVFSTDKSLYPLVKTSFEGLNTMRCLSPISGENVENIAITGEGIFDGNGQAWRMVKRSKLTNSQWKKLVASGGVVDKKQKMWYPSKSSERGAALSSMNVPMNFKSVKDYERIKDFLRPVLVNLVKCKNVLLEGPTFRNSPAWCLHPFQCENLIVKNVTVLNPWNASNGDGIDIESCKNSIIYNSTFSVGDDGICIKSGKNKPGYRSTVPTENLIIKNCTVYRAHGGVTIGSEMSGGVKNVHVSNCTFIGTDAGLRFKSKRGRSGVVENIYISDISMFHIATRAITFNMHYGSRSVPAKISNKELETYVNEPMVAVDEGTPQFKNIFIRNVSCKGASQAVYLQGLPEMALQHVVLKNITIEAKHGLFCMDAKGITIDGFNLICDAVPSMTFLNSKDISISNLTLSSIGSPLVSIAGPRTENIQMKVNNPDGLKKLIEFEKGASSKSLRISSK